MAASDLLPVARERIGPAQSDLDKCVHCGLCLNACPTYRELGVEMDSPRGRIYQMNEVGNGAPISDAYIEHLDLCLACRGCETACPSGVPYGRMIEAARAEINHNRRARWYARLFSNFVFRKLLPSRTMLSFVGRLLSLYESSGLQRILRASGLLKVFGKLANIEALTPRAEKPFFFQQIGQIFPAEGKQRFRVAFHAGCIANVAFARLNEATIRVLQKNGCEVVTPERQTCCGALHLHSGREHEAQALARANVDEFTSGGYDAIITNAAGCGSTLKEYGQLLQHDPAYADRARLFSKRVKDVTEFLAGIDLIRDMGPLRLAATYQDSCHLAHGQKIKSAPRKILNAIPGLKLIEMPMADVCCGSAGIYNVVHNDLAMRILEHKMQHANATSASVIATANPGCMLQLSAGARLYGSGQRVAHVVELLDEAYRNYRDAS